MRSTPYLYNITVATFPKSDSTKLLITQAADSLNAVYDTLHILRVEMLRLASLLPEFGVVMEMQGAGEIAGPQLMAEIGDVRRFTHRGALVACFLQISRKRLLQFFL